MRLRVSITLVAMLHLVAACTEAPEQIATAPASAESPRTGTEGPTLCPHGVPSELCTKCNPDLADVYKAQSDWCAEHGLPKSHCRECNPDLTFAAPAAPTDWCKEHAVPESKCTKCDPSLVATFVASGDYCREHGYPASVCPYCHPELVAAAGQDPPRFPEPGTVVRLASPETKREAGIETTRVEQRPFARSLEVVGRLEFNRNRHAELSARDEAVVTTVEVDLGDEVAAGQPLVILASSAVGADQARLQAARARIETARRALDRERRLADRGISARRSVEEAEQELAAARAEESSARAALGAAGTAMGDAGGRYALTAPFKGTVVARTAVPGKTAGPGEVLVEVADLATIWARLDVPQTHATDVRSGQRVVIMLEGAGGADAVEGTVTRVADAVDAATRTVPVRVELPNSDGKLRAGAFVRATIELSGEHDAMLVPQESIQRAQGSTFVFVKISDTEYHPVAVEIGSTTRDSVEVVSGVAPGAEVVTTGAFLLKTEILKESIGAGCCDESGGEDK